MSRSRSPPPRPGAPSTDARGATPAARRSAPPAGAGPDRRAADRPGFFCRRHRRIVTVVLAAILAASFVYYVVPRIVGLGPTLRRLRSGRIGWLAVGVGLEALSMFGDIVMFRGVLAARGTPISWRRTADIRMAGAAATKLLAAAGTGGIALTNGPPAPPAPSSAYGSVGPSWSAPSGRNHAKHVMTAHPRGLHRLRHG